MAPSPMATTGAASPYPRNEKQDRQHCTRCRTVQHSASTAHIAVSTAKAWFLTGPIICAYDRHAVATLPPSGVLPHAQVHLWQKQIACLNDWSARLFLTLPPGSSVPRCVPPSRSRVNCPAPRWQWIRCSRSRWQTTGILCFIWSFKAGASHAPMPWRMLDYMPRLALTYHLPLERVVLYIGRGRGPTILAFTTWRALMARQC